MKLFYYVHLFVIYYHRIIENETVNDNSHKINVSIIVSIKTDFCYIIIYNEMLMEILEIFIFFETCISYI
jgi:hypothetical protein